MWLLSAALLTLGGLVQAVAVTLVWLPCSDSMLNGSVLVGYRFGTDFSEPCLQAMDAGVVVPLPTAAAGWTVAATLGVIAAVILVTAWLVILPALRVPRWVRWLAAMPALAVISQLTTTGMAALGSAPAAESLSTATAFLTELSVLIALLALAAANVGRRVLLRAGIVLIAASASGAVHQLTEYVAMLTFSEADWDIPPGTGYLTVALILASAAVTAYLWRRAAHRVPAAAGSADSFAVTRKDDHG